MARVELRTEFMASGVRCVCLASFGVTRSTVTGSPRTAPVARQEGPCDVKAWYEGLLARHFRHGRSTSARRPPATSTGPSSTRPRDSRVASREAGLATQAPPHWQACWQRTVCVAQHDIAVRAGGPGGGAVRARRGCTQKYISQYSRVLHVSSVIPKSACPQHLLVFTRVLESIFMPSSHIVLFKYSQIHFWSPGEQQAIHRCACFLQELT